ncbi:cupin domain-containing protein [Mangrovibacillus cuniculi]|uniref:Cupin domain-containing protein n=1 Tax=Mangrovibacillus cuniculi TaxID=2593652 RepID=A0A7S8CDA0_9BACI|nr:cupin domain-containing protein [Mangrovibacillus cuniculi]QPC47879.1 cupin domain-containing protein [Mangrovibacillus cuniculi]
MYRNQYPYQVHPHYYTDQNYRNYSHFNTIPQNYQYARAQDYGKQPFVLDINQATLQNNTYRTAIWTGQYLQTTLMSIPVYGDIGLERHPDLDQFLRIEQGQGIVQMGKDKNNLTFQQPVADDYAIYIPAGYWHNLTNVGNVPLKLYSIYAPPNHPPGTVHVTKADAMAAEE